MDLIDWYHRNRRDLPWRRTRDPYAIWVSEIMLQQTTVATATPRWHRFMDRFPSVEALARADESEVLAEWSGLGYYARARNLHGAAQRIVSLHGGRMPSTYEGLLSLPGMGSYTAAAVASIAFGEPAVALDTNIERVIARLHMVGIDVRTTTGKRALMKHAQDMLERDKAGDWNQAMMELGATVCLPREPRCAHCPLSGDCGAHAHGREDDFPVKSPKPPMNEVREAAAVLTRGERVFVLQRPPHGSFANMWEVPRIVMDTGETGEMAAVRAMAQRAGIHAAPGRHLVDIRHTVMRRRIQLCVWEVRTRARRARFDPLSAQGTEWITPEQWLQRPISTTQRKIAMMLSGVRNDGGGA